MRSKGKKQQQWNVTNKANTTFVQRDFIKYLLGKREKHRRLWDIIYAQTDEMQIARLGLSDLLFPSRMSRNAIKDALEDPQIEQWVKVTKEAGKANGVEFATNNNVIYNVCFINKTFSEMVKLELTTRIPKDEEVTPVSELMPETKLTTRIPDNQGTYRDGEKSEVKKEAKKTSKLTTRTPDNQGTYTDDLTTEKSKLTTRIVENQPTTPNPEKTEEKTAPQEISKLTTTNTERQALAGIDKTPKKGKTVKIEATGDLFDEFKEKIVFTKVEPKPYKPKAHGSPSDLPRDLGLEFVNTWVDFFRDRNNGATPQLKWAVEMKGVREIVVQLRGMGIKDELLILSWKKILEKWDDLDDYYRQQIRIIQINTNLLNIINQLNNPRLTAHERLQKKLNDKIAGKGRRIDYSHLVSPKNRDAEDELGNDKAE